MTTRFRSCRKALLVASVVSIALPASAETWRAVSVTIGDERMTTPISTFTDGLADEQSVLSNRPDAAPASLEDVRVTIGFLDMRESIPGSHPVQVNADAGTVDLSSIYATGWRAELDCTVHPTSCDQRTPHLAWVAVIGWDFGPVQALPFVKTIDGDMMATWNAVASRVSKFDGFGTQRIQFTFAQPLAESRDGFVKTDKVAPGIKQVSGIATP